MRVWRLSAIVVVIGRRLLTVTTEVWGPRQKMCGLEVSDGHAGKKWKKENAMMAGEGTTEEGVGGLKEE